MLNEQLFHHDGLSLNYATGPRNGPALVFFHGVLRRWQCFVPLIPSLSSRWQIHALDHRGHGGSSRPKSGYLVRDYVGDAVAFVRDEGSLAYPYAALAGIAIGGIALGIEFVVRYRFGGWR